MGAETDGGQKIKQNEQVSRLHETELSCPLDKNGRLRYTMVTIPGPNRTIVTPGDKNENCSIKKIEVSTPEDLIQIIRTYLTPIESAADPNSIPDHSPLIRQILSAHYIVSQSGLIVKTAANNQEATSAAIDENFPVVILKINTIKNIALDRTNKELLLFAPEQDRAIAELKKDIELAYKTRNSVGDLNKSKPTGAPEANKSQSAADLSSPMKVSELATQNARVDEKRETFDQTPAGVSAKEHSPKSPALENFESQTQSSQETRNDSEFICATNDSCQGACNGASLPLGQADIKGARR